MSSEPVYSTALQANISNLASDLPVQCPKPTCTGLNPSAQSFIPNSQSISRPDGGLLALPFQLADHHGTSLPQDNWVTGNYCQAIWKYGSYDMIPSAWPSCNYENQHRHPNFDFRGIFHPQSAYESLITGGNFWNPTPNAYSPHYYPSATILDALNRGHRRPITVAAPTCAFKNPPPPSLSDRYKTFHHFAKLPTEIRLKIWAQNLPQPQTVHLNYNIRDIPKDLYNRPDLFGNWQILHGHGAVANSQICQESRAELIRGGYEFVPLASDHTAGFWFNYSTDRMFWNTNASWGSGILQDHFAKYRQHRTDPASYEKGPVCGPSFLPLGDRFSNKLRHLSISTRLFAEWSFLGGNIYHDREDDDWDPCRACYPSLRNGHSHCLSCCQFLVGGIRWIVLLYDLLQTLDKLEIVMIPDHVDTYMAGDFQFQATKYSDLEESARDIAITRFLRIESRQLKDSPELALIIDSKLEIVEIAGVKTSQSYIRHGSLANEYLNLYQTDEEKAQAPDAYDEIHIIGADSMEWTSAEGHAKLLEEVGSFADVCPVLLLRANRFKVTCDVPGCIGKRLCDKMDQFGVCTDFHCQRSDNKVIHVRKTCAMEANFGSWQGVCTYNTYGGGHIEEHERKRVHEGEPGGEHEWICRKASASLIPAHEMGLWLVDEKNAA